MTAPRDSRIDFWRGMALLVIASNHLPDNLITRLTPLYWGWFDMADLFVFLSGRVGIPALLRRNSREGSAAAAGRLIRRTALLYLAYITVGSLFVWWVRALGSGLFAGEISERLLLCPPAEVPWRISRLTVRVSHLAILPLYMQLALVTACCGWLLATRPRLLMGLSLGLYLAVQIQPGLVRWPDPWQEALYYNLFAWQFLYCLGGCSAVGPLRSSASWNALPFGRTWGVAAMVVLVGYALLKQYGLSDWYPATKPTLGWPRLLHLGSAWLAAEIWLPRSNSIYESWWLAPITQCGRNALTVYSGGALLSAWGVFGKARLPPGLTTDLLLTLWIWLGCVACATLAAGLVTRWSRLEIKPSEAGRGGHPPDRRE